MESSTLNLTQDEFSAYQLGGLMDGTSQPDETAAEERTRRAAIIEMYRSFDPGSPLESTMACNCIHLQFMLNRAMRDAGNPNLLPAMAMRMRASAVTISKTLHLWMSKYESAHARNEARAAEARQSAEQQEAVSAPGKPDLMRKPPAQEQARQAAAVPLNPRPVPASPSMVLEPASGVRDAPTLPSATHPDAPPNGRLTVEASLPVA